jgi:hypothetical protein
MAAKLSLVAHTAEAHAFELSPKCTRDRPPERRLTHAGRADEQENRTSGIGPQFNDCERLEYPLLNVIEAVMVLVEDLSRFNKI